MPSIATVALKNNRVMLAIVVGLMLFGVYSYRMLPSQEDPKITIREAVITTQYPGMSAESVELLVTKTIEERVRQLPAIEEIRSTSLPGSSIVHAEARQTIAANDLAQVWDDMRNELEGIESALPEGTGPVVVDDDFGDVAVLTVALLAEERFDMGHRQDMAQHISDMLFKVEGVKKIDVHGLQEERVFVESSNALLAQLGISPSQIIQELQAQNIIRPGGVIDAGGRNFTIQPSGNFTTLTDLRNALITVPNQPEAVALRDIATVTRSVVDPPSRTAYFNGEQAIIFAISQSEATDVLKFTPRIESMIEHLNQTIPAGYRLETVTRQADVVRNAVYGVSISVLQTIAVVTLVVVMFLGLKTGIIVSTIVPATILLTLSVMNFVNVPLERMSLATLIIALGLLVDDGILMAEDFKTRIDNDQDRDSALDRTASTLAVPSLVASLTTILVFLPLMLADSNSGEYTRSISIVVLISLLISWALSLTFTLYLCHRFVGSENEADKNWLRRNVTAFFNKLNPVYERLLRAIMRARPVFLMTLLAFFCAGIWLMGKVPQKFFPDSDRPQVLVYLDMPAGTSMRETDATLRAIQDRLLEEQRFPHIERFAAYGGFGGPRFVLSLTPIDPEPSKGFLMVDVGQRQFADPTIDSLRELLAVEFPGVFARVTKMFLGPSDSSLISVQIKGPDMNYIYSIAQTMERMLFDINGSYDIKNDWENRVTELRVSVNQLNARRAGVTSADVARSLEGYFSGRAVTEFREGDDIFPIVLRAKTPERVDLDRLQSVTIYSGANGSGVPLTQVADVTYVTRFARIARENLFRTVTVQAKNKIMTAEEVAVILDPELEKLRGNLLPGYEIEYDGVVQESKQSQSSLSENLPLCLSLMIILVLAQFNSVRATGIVFLTVPLIVIGASVGLFVMGANLGFMVILGLYALAGIIINNAVILIDRIGIERGAIDKERVKGKSQDGSGVPHFEAVIRASVRRLRPIVMSTVTTILGLMPLILSKDVLFYGMASTIAFGLAAGTVLTLGFVPVLYTYFFGIDVSSEPRDQQQ